MEQPQLIINCNISGFDLIKQNNLELKPVTNNAFQLYLPKTQQFCIFETSNIGYLSYKLTDNLENKDLMFLSISKKNTKTELIFQIAKHLKQHIESTLDKNGFAKALKVYYGFGDKKISFNISTKLAKSITINKIKFKWTIDISVDNKGIVTINLNVLDIQQ
jgi:hypothetical protein